MKYIDARKLIQTGDILACSGSGCISDAIKLWTQSEISHIGIALWINFPQDEDPNRLCILEAHALKGVRLALLSNVILSYGQSGYVYWQKLNGLDGDQVASYALQNWNKAYASPYQFVIAASRIIQILRKLTKRPLNIHPDRFHCSELATRSLMSAGFKHDKDPSVTTPGDVSDFRCLEDRILLELDVGYTRTWSPNTQIRNAIGKLQST